MASSGDVDMANADRSSGSRSTSRVLEAIVSGTLDKLTSFAPTPTSHTALEVAADSDETDRERDLLAPFLPLLSRLHDARRRSSATSGFPSPLDTVLNQYEFANELSEYTEAVHSLTLHDLTDYAAESADGTPLYRQFEGADARERVCIVLQLVMGFSDGSRSKESIRACELVRNDIYKPHLAAIFVNALATDALISSSPSSSSRGISLTLTNVVHFCLIVPLGVELLEAVVLNDPSSCSRVIEVVVQSIHSCNPLQSSGSDALSTTSLVGSASTLLPFELRQAQAACSALAALSPVYATQVVCRLRDDVSSVAAAFVAFQLLVEMPSLREKHGYAPFVYQWMKQSASSQANASAPAALYTFLLASLSPETEALGDPDKLSAAASFVEEARYVMSQFRQLLIEDIVQFQLPPAHDAQTPSRYTLVTMLNVLIGMLVVGRLHPEDHETTQLLRLFDKVTKEIPPVQPQVASKRHERMISLMYILVLLLCAPSAAAFAKMPSQREDSTKLVLQLAQQCIYSLYNTKAACPLFILSSVLLYTKSPSLLPFLNSFLGDTFPLVAPTLRVENLHGVGDAILKPILTENVMAREVLTALEPAHDLSARDRDAMEEIVLRSLHGLLTEKSFLRHQHARKLKDWMTLLLDRATTPVHPLVVSVLLEWIENYVMAFEYPIAQRPLLQLAVVPLAPAFLNRALGHVALSAPYSPENKREWARGAFVLVYAMQFNQRLRLGSALPGTKLYAFANLNSQTDPPDQHLPAIRSSADVVLSYELDAFQLKNIASQVSQFGGYGGDFEFVAPTLLRLMADEYPHLVDYPVPSRVADRGRAARWGHAKRNFVVLGGAANCGSDTVPTISWNSACLWLDSIRHAQPRHVERAVVQGIGSLLPLAILSLGQSTVDSVSPEDFIASFAEVMTSCKSVSDPVLIDRRLVETLCMPHVVWRHFQQTQVRRSAQASSSASSSSTYPSWISREQLIEQPFYVFQNAHEGVLTSPPLLRLVLDVVKKCREECVFRLRRQENTLALVKRAAQANNDASTGTTTPPMVSVTDPATQQFLLVQDCILVQSMLSLLAELGEAAARQEKDECEFLLYSVIDELLVQPKSTSSALSVTASPPLALVVHIQGYKLSLVPSLVDRAGSLKQLWMYWMHQSSVETSHKGSSDRRGGGGTNATKAIADFILDPAIEKDPLKWQFRARVLFKLCEKYFSSPSQTGTVLYAMKQIFNRLRLVVASSIGSSKGALHAATIGDEAARLSFVDAVLNDAIDGCGPHHELRSELYTHLLSLKKHLGAPGNQSQRSAAASPSSVEAAATHSADRVDLELIVFRAFQRIVQIV